MPQAAKNPRVVPEAFRLGGYPRDVYDRLDGRATLRDLAGRYTDAEERLAYLRTLSAGKREDRFDKITQQPIPVFILTKGLEPLPDFLARLREREIPLLRSPELSSLVIKRVSWFLEDHLVPSAHVHGVLLDWHRIPFTCSYLPGKRFVGHSALIGFAACLLFTLASGGFVRMAIVGQTRGLVILTSLLVIGFWLRERRLAAWRRTPLMFEDEFPDQPLQLQL